jgi:glutaredoxin-like YruB-family protein
MKHHGRRHRLYLYVLVFAFLISPITAGAALYKWVDDKGVFHMSDTPPDPATAEKYTIEKSESDESEPAPVEEAKEAKSARHEVVVYVTPTCPYCRQAKEFLSQKGVFYAEKDVSADPAARDEMVALTGRDAVPVIVIDGEPIVGFNGQKIEEKLGFGRK